MSRHLGNFPFCIIWLYLNFSLNRSWFTLTSPFRVNNDTDFNLRLKTFRISYFFSSGLPFLGTHLFVQSYVWLLEKWELSKRTHLVVSLEYISHCWIEASKTSKAEIRNETSVHNSSTNDMWAYQLDLIFYQTPCILISYQNCPVLVGSKKGSFLRHIWLNTVWQNRWDVSCCPLPLMS